MAVLVLRSVVALLVLCLCRGQGEVRCPENVLPFAALCLPTDLSNGLVSDMSVLQQYCRQGLFEQSVECLTDLGSACQNHRDQSRLLSQLLDLEAWQRSWNSLCARLLELEEHFACWTMTSQMSAECIQNKMADFRSRVTSSDDVIVSSLSSSSSTASTTISLPSSVKADLRGRQHTVTLQNLRIYCNTSQQILHCFQPALYEFCPLEISRLLENTYLAFQPPLCEQQENELSEDACETEDTTITSSGNKVPFGLLSPFLMMMMILSSAYF